MSADMSADFGVVTAYGYALSKGYQGTEEEFAAHMARNAGIAAEVDALKGAVGFHVYARPTDYQIVKNAVDLSNANVMADHSIARDGSVIEETGFNIIEIPAEADKTYFIRARNGSAFISHRLTELVKNNSAIAYQHPTNSGYDYVKIADFAGTIRVCYRNVDSLSFQCCYAVQPYEEAINANSAKIVLLENKISNLFETGKNLYRKEDNTDGYYISWNDNVLRENPGSEESDFIPVTAGETYTVNLPNQTKVYNADREYLGGFYLYRKNGAVRFESSEALGDSSLWASYTDAEKPLSFTAQTGWAYIRQTLLKRNADITMIEKSAHYTGFEPSVRKIPSLSADAEKLFDLNRILADRTFAKIVREPVNIKLLGDSITAGVGGTGYDASSSGGGELICSYNGGIYSNVSGKCWANSLKAYWEEKFNVHVKNFGWSGIATDHLITYWPQLVHDDDDILICTIGTNDRAARADIAEFIANLEDIYIKCVAAHKLLVFMADIPASVSNETNGTKNFHMEDVEHAIRYVTDKHNIPFVNLYGLFMDYCKYTGTTIDSYLSDGLHPNDAGYELMFELITQAFGISPKRPGAVW